MISLVSVLAGVVLLGTAFIGVQASTRPFVQSRGPWLISACMWIIATFVVSTYDRELTSLLQRPSRRQINDVLLTAVVMAILAGEAVLISGWAMRTGHNKVTYLVVFSCTTLVAWFVTLLVLSSVVPGS